MLLGSRISQAIYVAAQLGIADHLEEGPKTCDELAASTGANADALYRLLRALASAGIFTEASPRAFTLTPMAAFLQTKRSDSLRPGALIQGGLWWRPWGELLHSVRTGDPAFERVFGMGYFEYLHHDAEAADAFDAAMATGTARMAAATATVYDFSSAKTVVDVGGGHGALLAAILSANPSVQGILFDVPSVLDGARKAIAAAGVAERCTFVTGDFLQSVPPGGDIYLLKWILHDWDDEHASVILRNCRHVMRPQGKLLVVEVLIPPGNDPFDGKFLDLNMLVLTRGGRERTEAEYQALLAAAGFRLTDIIPTASPTGFHVIEGACAETLTSDGGNAS